MGSLASKSQAWLSLRSDNFFWMLGPMRSLPTLHQLQGGQNPTFARHTHRETERERERERERECVRGRDRERQKETERKGADSGFGIGLASTIRGDQLMGEGRSQDRAFRILAASLSRGAHFVHGRRCHPLSKLYLQQPKPSFL